MSLRKLTKFYAVEVRCRGYHYFDVVEHSKLISIIKNLSIRKKCEVRIVELE